VSDSLGIARWQLRAALHQARHRGNLGMKMTNEPRRERSRAT